MSNSLDYIILGQGLAGSLLAWRLMRTGYRIRIIDEAAGSTTSKVAAGLVNPVIGKRLVLHDEVPDALQLARQFYQQLSETLSQQYYFPLPMLRLIKSSEDEALWRKRIDDPRYQNYLSPELCNTKDYGLLAHAAFEQWQCGYLDTVALLNDLRHYFIEQGVYEQQKIEVEDIHPHANGVKVAGYEAPAMFFCEGYQARNNPWFADLPWQMSQGEILSLKISGADINAIINGRFWLLPLDQGNYRMGASYSTQLDLHCQPEHKQQMLDYLQSLLAEGSEIHVIEQQVGIRPNTLDKSPFIGQHPQQQSLWMFNGFGSRGSLLIPYYVNVLLDCMRQGTCLPGHVDVRRVM